MASSYAKRKLKRIAFHEAGHAVVACLMDIPFSRVAVTPNNKTRDSDGMITHGYLTLEHVPLPDCVWPFHADFDPRRAREYMGHNICMTLAGPLAETLHTRCWQDLPMNKGDDEYVAFFVADLLYSQRKPQHEFVNRLRFQTLEMLEQADVWAAVTAVAQKLVVRKRLNRAQVNAVVSEVVQDCGAFRPLTRRR